MIFDPTRRNVAYLASDGGVAQSLDGGMTWEHINNVMMGGWGTLREGSRPMIPSGGA